VQSGSGKVEVARTDKDYAIEHGRYLANAAEQFLLEQNRAAQAERPPDSEFWTALETAIYEFRKRAARAEGKATP